MILPFSHSSLATSHITPRAGATTLGRRELTLGSDALSPFPNDDTQSAGDRKLQRRHVTFSDEAGDSVHEFLRVGDSDCLQRAITGAMVHHRAEILRLIWRISSTHQRLCNDDEGANWSQRCQVSSPSSLPARHRSVVSFFRGLQIQWR